MVSETWKCTKCENEITFNVKRHFKDNPISKKCECGGLWKYKEKRGKRRKSMEIWRDIHKLLNIDFDNYDESIRYANFNQKEMIKLENAIKKITLLQRSAK